jgi:hypothetical protein
MRISLDIGATDLCCTPSAAKPKAKTRRPKGLRRPPRSGGRAGCGETSSPASRPVGRRRAAPGSIREPNAGRLSHSGRSPRIGISAVAVVPGPRLQRQHAAPACSPAAGRRRPGASPCEGDPSSGGGAGRASASARADGGAQRPRCGSVRADREAVAVLAAAKPAVPTCLWETLRWCGRLTDPKCRRQGLGLPRGLAFEAV